MDSNSRCRKHDSTYLFHINIHPTVCPLDGRSSRSAGSVSSPDCGGLTHIDGPCRTRFRPDDVPRTRSRLGASPNHVCVPRRRRTTTCSATPASVARSHTPRPSATRPSNQTAACEIVANLFPEMALGPQLLPSRLEQRATQLLHLVHQEGQHHQQGQHHRQVLLAMSVIVFQVIALVLQGVESLFSCPRRLPGPGGSR